jgi:hypothetical protein
MLTCLLKPSALYDLYQDHHNCDDQENVNESTHGIGRNQAKQPEDYQDNRNRSEHFRTSSVNAESNRNPAISVIKPRFCRDNKSISSVQKNKLIDS